MFRKFIRRQTGAVVDKSQAVDLPNNGYSCRVKMNPPLDTRVGLCEHCRWMRKIKSDRGSVFYLCERSATDPNFPKYPRLPVLRCAGYEALDPVRDSTISE